MSNTNYISISIKLLDISPLLDDLITNLETENENEELLIIFQGNNTFYDLRQLLNTKEEITIKLNKNKKTIIISLVKSDILLSTTIFNIKNGENWILFNFKENDKNIKIKLSCNIKEIKEDNFLIKNNSSNNININLISKENNNNNYSPLNSENINYNINSYEFKSSFTNNTNYQNNNPNYIHTANNNSNSNSKQKIISKLNKNNIKKPNSNIYFNKNELNKKLDLSVKGKQKIINNKINEELKTIEGIKSNKKIKTVKNSKGKNIKIIKEENKNNKENYNNVLYKDYFHLSSKLKNINIKTELNINKNKLNNSPYTSKTYRKSDINKTKRTEDKNKEKDIYLNQELNLLIKNKNNQNESIPKTNGIKKTNTNENIDMTDNKLDFSEEILNNEEDSFELNKFDKLKEDFLLLYNEEYNNNIKEDFLKLEIDLFLEKMIELINTFHINITEKLVENKILENKYKAEIDQYILIKKLNSKLEKLKNFQNIKLNIFNNTKYKNLLNLNEINLFKFILPNNSNDYNKNQKLKEILNIILNKNENKKLLNEESIKKLEKYNIINNKKQLNNNNDSLLLNHIKNNSVDKDVVVIYKKKSLISYPLKNRINNNIKN